MRKGISLFGRKRIRDFTTKTEDAVVQKKDELMAMKLQEMDKSATLSGNLQMLPIDHIKLDRTQPPKTFRQLDALAASMVEKGMMQPVIVKIKNEQGIYHVIAGERRYLAAVKAGLAQIPCILREDTDANTLILQLLENNQREDVSPLEEAEALQQLINQLGVNKLEVAKEIGRDPAWISIRLGLNEASDAIKGLVKDGFIEDIRTLHDLRMFEKEAPKRCHAFIDRVRQNQIAGSYREAISLARQGSKQSKSSQKVMPTPQYINKIERVEDALILHLKGKKRPTQFTLSAEVWQAFLASVK